MTLAERRQVVYELRLIQCTYRTAYPIIINLLDNTATELSKFRKENWAEINDWLDRAYNTKTQIKFQTTMIKSNLCDYSDAYKLVKGSITFVGQGAHTAAIVNDRNNKNVIFKNCDHLLTASVKKKNPVR